MSDLTSSHADRLGRPRDLQISLTPGSDRSFTVSWGGGTARKVFDTDSPELCAVLFTADFTREPSDVTEALAEQLDCSPDDARNLVRALDGYDFFGAKPPSPYYDEWLKLGWADALAIHQATADCRWVHDYRGAPQVMVRDSTNAPVRPTAPKPLPRFAEGTVTIPLPDPRPVHTPYREYFSGRRTKRNFRNTTASLEDIATIARWTVSKDHLPDQKFVSPTYIDDGPFLGRGSGACIVG